MGKLKVIKTGPMATIQDFGRFGYRQYGIPQSGAMDNQWMIAANRLVGNPHDYPVVEFAMLGLKLEAVERTTVSVVGAAFKLNGKVQSKKSIVLRAGDLLEISAPAQVYAYMGIGGKIRAKEDFGSVATYSMAGFGGIDGRNLKADDTLATDDAGETCNDIEIISRGEDQVTIHMMKGPEWDVLKELPDTKEFQVDRSSDRMGIRLIGSKLECDYREIDSSAVIPGTVQLPANGRPIILMNDCQTTGGYPRIGKVIAEDLGKLVQVKGNKKIAFKLIS